MLPAEVTLKFDEVTVKLVAPVVIVLAAAAVRLIALPD